MDAKEAPSTSHSLTADFVGHGPPDTTGSAARKEARITGYTETFGTAMGFTSYFSASWMRIGLNFLNKNTP